MSEKTEPCAGITVPSALHGEDVYYEHCPGCTKATERANAVSGSMADAIMLYDGLLKLCRATEKDLTSMRTLAGELAVAIRAFADCDLYDAVEEGEPIEVIVKAALAKAKELGVGDGG